MASRQTINRRAEPIVRVNFQDTRYNNDDDSDAREREGRASRQRCLFRARYIVLVAPSPATAAGYFTQIFPAGTAQVMDCVPASRKYEALPAFLAPRARANIFPRAHAGLLFSEAFSSRGAPSFSTILPEPEVLSFLVYRFSFPVDRLFLSRGSLGVRSLRLSVSRFDVERTRRSVNARVH